MKQQPSFGMKRNNEHALKKDKVSFGMFSWAETMIGATVCKGICKGTREIINSQLSPEEIEMRNNHSGEIGYNFDIIDGLESLEHQCEQVLDTGTQFIRDINEIPAQCFQKAGKAVKDMKGKGFKGVVKCVSKVVGAPVSAITTTVHEVKKDLNFEPSSPREKEARVVVDTYTAGTAATGAALGAIPFVGSSADSFKVSPDQRKLMVQEIADIYELSREEKYDLFESLNLDDYNRFEGPITDVVSISGKKTAEYIAEKATSEVIQEGASQIASTIPGAKSCIRARVNSVSVKKLGEKAIKECKRIAKRH